MDDAAASEDDLHEAIDCAVMEHAMDADQARFLHGLVDDRAAVPVLVAERDAERGKAQVYSDKWVAAESRIAVLVAENERLREAIRVADAFLEAGERRSASTRYGGITDDIRAARASLGAHIQAKAETR